MFQGKSNGFHSQQILQFSEYKTINFRRRQERFTWLHNFIDDILQWVFKLFKGGAFTVATVRAYGRKVNINTQNLDDVASHAVHPWWFQSIWLWPTNILPGVI